MFGYVLAEGAVMTTRRTLGGAGLLLGINGDADQTLAELWGRLLRVEWRLDHAWALVERGSAHSNSAASIALFERADAIGHEYDCIVQQIASQPASSWEGVTIKLLAWRRTANLSELDLPDADTALAFSAYLDALRLCPAAIGLPNDAAIARLALRGPDSIGG